MVAIAVVAIPFTGVFGSPALKPSGPDPGHSPPRRVWIRSATSCAVSAFVPRNGICPAASVPANRLNLRLDTSALFIHDPLVVEHIIRGGRQSGPDTIACPPATAIEYTL
jgi:hypothetical protein